MKRPAPSLAAALFVAALGAEAAAQSLVVPPWIVRLEDGEAILAWITAEECIDSLTLDGGAAPLRMTDSSPARIHRVRFTGLAPGVHHRWRHESGITGEFRCPAPGDRFRFGVIGHTGGSESVSALDPAARISALLDQSPDFVLHCGDLLEYCTTDSFARDFGALFGAYARSRPVYVVPGNHEAAWPHPFGADWRFFREAFPQPFEDDRIPWYRIRRGPLEVFVMAGYALASLDDPQIEAVLGALRDSPAELRILAFGGHNYSTASGLDRAQVESHLALRAAEAGADLLLAGDGPGARFARTVNVPPVCFTGASSVFRMIEVLPYELRIESFEGGRRTEIRSVFSRRRKATVLDLLQDERARRTGFAATGAAPASDPPSIEINGLSLRREDVSGVEVAIEAALVPGQKRTAIPFEVEFRPRFGPDLASTIPGWFRCSRSEIDVTSPGRPARVAFPERLPYIEGSWAVDAVRVSFQSRKEEIESIRLLACRFFRD